MILQFVFLVVPLFALSIASSKYTQTLGYRGTLVLGVVGVAVHELGHLVAATLFNQKILDVSLFKPSTDGSLGYVTRSYRPMWYSPFTNLVIAMAPLVSGSVAFLLVTFTLRPDLLPLLKQLYPQSLIQNYGVVANFLSAVLSQGNPIQTCLWLYLSSSILLFTSPSKADFQGAIPGAVWLTCIVVGTSFLFQDCFFDVGALASVLTAFGVVLWTLLIVLIVFALITFGSLYVLRTLL